MNLRIPAALAATTALAFGAAACGSDDESSSSSSTGSASAAKVEPVAKIDSLSGKQTTVTLDPGFVEALTALKVTPGPVGNATITKGGNAIFPITGGNVTYYKPGSRTPYVESKIDHAGSGLSLTAGGKKVELTDFVIDAGKSVLTGKVSVDGKVAAESAPLFFLDGRTLKPLEAKDNGTAVLEGTTVKLKKEAADLLNMTFGIQDLTPGLVIGVAKITVNTA